MKIKGDTVTINIKGHLSLWSMIKLRIASSLNIYGKGIRGEDKAKEKEEVNGIQILFKNGFERDKEEEEAEASIKKPEEMGGEVAEQLENLNEAGLAPEKTQEVVGAIRINKRSGKVEISSRVYFSNVGIVKVWVGYDEDLLARSFGMCPQCYSTHSLLNFKRMKISKYGNTSRTEETK